MVSTPLNIKDPEAYELARQIADHTGKSLTRVVVDALRQEKDRVLPRRVDRDAIRKLLAHAHSLPERDPRSSSEILADMYDEHGQWK